MNEVRHPPADAHVFLVGGSEMGRLIRGHDWSATPLGPLEGWPSPLRTTLNVMLLSPVPMVLLWGDEGIMLYNDAYSVFARGRHPELLGSRVREGWPEVAAFNDNVMVVGLAGGTLRYRDQELTLYRHGRPEQVWMNLDYSPVHDERGRPAGVLCILAETTERMEAERQREAAEAALRRMNETLEARVAEGTSERNRLWTLSQDMLARADYEGMMSAVSPAWSRVLGWSEAELLTRPYASFMHPEDTHVTLEALNRMGETGLPTRFENRIATVEGGWKPIEWTVAPEPDAPHFIAVGRDLSDAKAREHELRLAQEALRQAQKMEAMGSLTGGVAHDFNNLLTPIVAVLDRLRRRPTGDEREQRLIEGATQSAERARTLVQRLLAFARRQPLQPTAVDVGLLVRNMAELVASTTGPQIRVTVEVAPGLPAARSDANQLEMAILNLAVNARDAMPSGGALRLSALAEEVRASDAARLKISPGRYVRLSVADTGTGMDEATLERAVEPFFSTKGIGKGTGLGLSMVHGFASQLGGALEIRSQPRSGTSVELWLPESEEAPEVASSLQAPRWEPTQGTALVVDDEAAVRLATADMLGELGFEVVEVASAEEARALLDQGARVDLLVTDHLMPGMTGTDLARRVRLKRQDLPILIVSGYADVEGIAPDLPRLTKPFRKDELVAALAGLLAASPP